MKDEPFSIVAMTDRWVGSLKVIGAGNGTGLIAGGAALNAFASKPEALFFLKLAVAAFFAGVLFFSLAFMLIEIAIFAWDDYLTEIQETQKPKDMSHTQGAAAALHYANRHRTYFNGSNRLAMASGAAYFVGLTLAFVGFLRL